MKTANTESGTNVVEPLHSWLKVHPMEDRHIAHEIRLHITPVDQGVFVHSDDVPGLFLVGESVREMRPDIENAVKSLIRDNQGIAVEVSWLAQEGESKQDVRSEFSRLAVCPIEESL